MRNSLLGAAHYHIPSLQKTEVVIYWLVAADVPVHYQFSPCGISGGQIGT
jgi:hypothetical protein